LKSKINHRTFNSITCSTKFIFFNKCTSIHVKAHIMHVQLIYFATTAWITDTYTSFLQPLSSYHKYEIQLYHKRM
jgi:hypothetical protein